MIVLACIYDYTSLGWCHETAVTIAVRWRANAVIENETRHFACSPGTAPTPSHHIYMNIFHFYISLAWRTHRHEGGAEEEASRDRLMNWWRGEQETTENRVVILQTKETFWILLVSNRDLSFIRSCFVLLVLGQISLDQMKALWLILWIHFWWLQRRFAKSHLVSLLFSRKQKARKYETKSSH